MKVPNCDRCGRFTTNAEEYDDWQPMPWNGPNTHRWCDRCKLKAGEPHER